MPAPISAMFDLLDDDTLQLVFLRICAPMMQQGTTVATNAAAGLLRARRVNRRLCHFLQLPTLWRSLYRCRYEANKGPSLRHTEMHGHPCVAASILFASLLHEFVNGGNLLPTSTPSDIKPSACGRWYQLNGSSNAEAFFCGIQHQWLFPDPVWTVFSAATHSPVLQVEASVIRHSPNGPMHYTLRETTFAATLNQLELKYQCCSRQLEPLVVHVDLQFASCNVALLQPTLQEHYSKNYFNLASFMWGTAAINRSTPMAMSQDASMLCSEEPEEPTSTGVCLQQPHDTNREDWWMSLPEAQVVMPSSPISVPSVGVPLHLCTLNNQLVA